MSPELVPSLYPWDLGADTDTTAWLERLGAGRVTLAAAYHGVRAATPRRRAGRVVEAPVSALYTRRRDEAWRGSRLAPADPVPGAGSFEDARDRALRAGVRVDAWVVLTHRDGVLHPAVAAQVCLTNAVGDVYQHALCPARDEVRSHVRTLVHEVLEVGQPDGLVLEACGPTGVGHQSAHDKLHGADWGPRVRELLSWCCCASCREEYAASGVDGDRVTAEVGRAVDGAVPDVAPEVRDVVLAVRRAQTTRLLADVRDVVGSDLPLRVHCTSHPDPTGPAVAAAALTGIEEYVVPCWQDGAADVAEVAALAGGAGAGAYVSVLEDQQSAEVRAAHWERLLASGADTLHLYHLGLASAARLDVAVEARRCLDLVRAG